MFTYLISEVRKRKGYVLFWALVVLGAVVRGFLIQHRDLFVDEVYYWRVSKIGGWGNLLFMKHWIKDHGILYYILLKILMYFKSDIPTLRYTNIIFYIVGSYAIFHIFKRKNMLTGIVCVIVFSFHRYFIYLASILTPYNLALCLTLISIASIYSFNSSKTNSYTKYASVFIMSTTLAFYADYSFLFTFPFYFLFLLFYLLNTNIEIEKKIVFIRIYVIVFILITPGILQFFHNYSAIQDLNADRFYLSSFIGFLYVFAGTTFLRITPYIGVMGVLLAPILLIFFKKKDSHMAWIYISCILFFYIVQRFYLPLFAERYMWFFYFMNILIMAELMNIRNMWSRGLVVAFIICCCINLLLLHSNVFRAPGEISTEVKLSLLLNNKYNIHTDRIIILEKGLSQSDVLLRYYFSPQYPRSDKYAQQVDKIKNKLVILSPKTGTMEEDVRALVKNGKSCTLFYIIKNNDITHINDDTLVKKLNCNQVYYLTSIYDYVEAFKQI